MLSIEDVRKEGVYINIDAMIEKGLETKKKKMKQRDITEK